MTYRSCLVTVMTYIVSRKIYLLPQFWEFSPHSFTKQYFSSMPNKENNVFKDALGVKGLGFKHHGNHPGNHGSHYGNHHGNYHDNHSNHHGNYHAEQLLFSCQCSKVSSCRVVRLSSCQVRFLGTLDMLNKFFLCPCSNLTVYRRKWQWFFLHPILWV